MFATAMGCRSMPIPDKGDLGFDKPTQEFGGQTESLLNNYEIDSTNGLNPVSDFTNRIHFLTKSDTSAIRTVCEKPRIAVNRAKRKPCDESQGFEKWRITDLNR